MCPRSQGVEQRCLVRLTGVLASAVRKNENYIMRLREVMLDVALLLVCVETRARCRGYTARGLDVIGLDRIDIGFARQPLRRNIQTNLSSVEVELQHYTDCQTQAWLRNRSLCTFLEPRHSLQLTGNPLSPPIYQLPLSALTQALTLLVCSPR